MIKKLNIIIQNIKIYADYELINTQAYDAFIKYFGKNNKVINKFDNILNLDEKYILVKYNNNCFEIIKKRNETERFLIIGKNNKGKEILEDLLNSNFENWLKSQNTTLNNLQNLSNSIYEEDKIIGKILKLNVINVDEFEIIDENEDVNDKFKKK